MKSRLQSFKVLIAVVGVLASCAQQVGDIDRTRPDAIAKSDLEGEWFVRHTMVEVPPSAAFAVTGNQSLTERIVWDIQKDFLIGRRAHEYRVGSEEGRQTNYITNENGELVPVFEGAVVVAYRIESHFDVQRRFNPSTGEQDNVLIENASDGVWNERAEMRVDWSQNLATDYFFFEGTDAKFQPISYFVSEVEKDNPDRLLATPDYMEVTGRISVAPDTINFPSGTYPECYLNTGTDCRDNIIKYKTSFMKANADREMYVPREWDQRDRAKFQMIDWFRSSHDDHYGQPNSTVQWMPLLYNLFDDMRKPVEARKLRPVVFYLNVNWPRDDEAVMWATRKSFTDWNVTFKEVVRNAGYTGPEENMVILCENNPVLQSDPEVCRRRVVHLTKGDDVVREEQDIFKITHNGHIGWGDLRFNQLNMIMEPQNYGSVLAFAQMAWNQESGEVMSASTHVLWTTMESYSNRVVDWVQLMSGDLPLEKYISGEHIREQVQNKEVGVAEVHSALTLTQPRDSAAVVRGKVDVVDASKLRRSTLEKLAQVDELRQMRGKLLRNIERQRDNGGTSVFAERVEQLGPMLETFSSRLREDLRAETGHWPDDVQPSDASVDAMVPLLKEMRDRRGEVRHRLDSYAERHMLSSENLFNVGQINYYAPLVERFRGRPRHEIEAYVRPIAWYYTVAHEIGHNLGLEHNFAGSNDALNFPLEYWLERTQAGFVPDYLIEDEELRQKLASNQLLRSSQFTSIMDYMPYDVIRDDKGRMRSGVGSADRAAVNYAYADVVEVFDASKVPETVTWSDNAGQMKEISIDRDVIAFDPEVRPKSDEFHYSTYPNLALKSEHHVRMCLSPLGHLCDAALPGVDFDEEGSDGIYVGAEKLTDANADVLGQVLFSAAVALSEGRRWANADDVAREGLIEVPYRTCENQLAGRTYHCEMHDFGVDLWERTQNLISSADFYYFITHFARDRQGMYTPAYYSWSATEFELGPLMNYNKHFINRGLIEDKQYFDNWFADPAGGLNGFLASLDILGHWQEFMAKPTMNDRESRLRYRRDNAGQLVSLDAITGASESVVEYAQYQLDRRDMTLRPVSPFNEDELDETMTVTFAPGEARYLRSEYDPSLGYDYFYRPVIYGSWISKMIAVELAADPYTRFVGKDTGADAAYALNLATLYSRETWKTMSGFFTETPELYSYGVKLQDDSLELQELHSPLNQVASAFPAPNYDAYVRPDESFTATLYAALYGVILFDLSADNPFAEASNVQILGEDRAIPEGSIEGEDYLLVPDLRTHQVYVVFRHDRAGGLFIRGKYTSPTWMMAERILDIYDRYGFSSHASYEDALSAAQSVSNDPDGVEAEFEQMRNQVEDDLGKFDVLRSLLVRYGYRHVTP